MRRVIWLETPTVLHNIVYESGIPMKMLRLIKLCLKYFLLRMV